MLPLSWDPLLCSRDGFFFQRWLSVGVDRDTAFLNNLGFYYSLLKYKANSNPVSIRLNSFLDNAQRLNWHVQILVTGNHVYITPQANLERLYDELENAMPRTLRQNSTNSKDGTLLLDHAGSPLWIHRSLERYLFIFQTGLSPAGFCRSGGRNLYSPRTS